MGTQGGSKSQKSEFMKIQTLRRLRENQKSQSSGTVVRVYCHYGAGYAWLDSRQGLEVSRLHTAQTLLSSTGTVVLSPWPQQPDREVAL